MSTDCHADCPATGCAPQGCPGDGSLAVEVPPEVPLGEALTRWQKEAVPGVCHTGRYRLRYWVWGSGPPLVIVHGLNDVPRSFALMMAPLSRHFTCVVYHLPEGCGDGARVGRYRLADYAADLVALLDHLTLPRSYVVGASFGSTIALTALHRYPQRLPRAVLLGGFAQRPMARWEIGMCLLARYWPGTLRALPFRRLLQNPESQPIFVSGGHADRWDFLTDNSSQTPMRAVALRGLLVRRTDLRPILPSIRQPILMICGDRDPVVPASCEPALLAGLPNVDRVEFPGCGHFPQYTHAPLTAEMIRRFLTPPA